MVRADRIILRPHDVGDELPGGPVIDHEVHGHVVVTVHEVPNLEDDVPLPALLPDAIRLDQPGAPLLPVVVPDGQQSAPTGTGAGKHLPQRPQQVVVVEQVGDGVVGGHHYVELPPVVIVDRPHIAYGEIDLDSPSLRLDFGPGDSTGR